MLLVPTRWLQQNAPQGGNVQLLVFNSGTNRMDGYTYDASGNLLNDGSSTFTYDAESQLVKAVKAGATTTYVYDAGGRRVRKSVAGVTTDYVYNLGGTVTEVNSAGVWSRTEVYAGGKHLATYAGGASGATYFNHTDWLGTERVRSDMTGAACETVTSLIFGDGQSVSGGCGDPSTRHFTGKQRDDESGLDDFGARYYSSQLGRFVSADWSAVPVPVPYANLTNPQTLNLYALVHENPSTFADLDGHLAPGQVGDPGGMAVQPRMRSANGNAYGCLDTGCDRELFALTITHANGTISTEYFNSQLEAEAAWLQQPVQNNPGQQTQSTSVTTPSCFAQLKTRDVNNKWAEAVGATHSFWYVQGSDGEQQLISGGPTKDGGKTVSDDGTGQLHIWIHGLTGSPDTPSSTTTWNSGLSPATCKGVDKMLSAAKSYPQDQLTYRFVGPNSNTVAHALGLVGGFSPPATPESYGWW